MARLFLVVLAILGALLVCAVCYGAIVWKLFRREGLARATLGALFPPFAYVWGWRHVRDRAGRPSPWMAGWTGASALFALGSLFLELQMG